MVFFLAKNLLKNAKKYDNGSNQDEAGHDPILLYHVGSRRRTFYEHLVSFTKDGNTFKARTREARGNDPSC